MARRRKAYVPEDEDEEELDPREMWSVLCPSRGCDESEEDYEERMHDIYGDF